MNRSRRFISAGWRSGWKASRSRTAVIRRANTGRLQRVRTNATSPRRSSPEFSRFTVRTVSRMAGSPTPRNSRSLFRYVFSAGARAGLRWRRSSTSIASARTDGRASCVLVKLGEDLFPEDVNPLELIPSDVVQVDAIESEVDELLDLARMGVSIGGDQHAALEVFRPDDLGHLLEVIRRADVGLWELHPAIRPFGQRVAHRLLVGGSPGEVELEDLLQLRRILARRARPFLEALEDGANLFLWGADRDDPIAKAPGLFGGDRPGGGDVDGGRLLRHGPEPHRLHLVVLARMLDVLPAEELPDELDRFEHAVDALGNFRPIGGDEVLVERLAGSEPQPETARVDRGHGGGRLGDDRGVRSKRGAGDARADVAPRVLRRSEEHTSELQ